MKKLLYILSSVLILTVSGCDLLVREPQDRLSPESFFKTETECRLFSNEFYTLLPSTIYTETADVIAVSTLSEEVSGMRTVPATSSAWNWDKLRDINFFLEHLHQCENADVRAEYEALARFFRAFFYFEKVKRFGDVPWVDHTIAADSDELYMGRTPRKEVMSHVLEDINYAIQYLPVEQSTYRINKWAALAIKSRIFLFEGTFRKYHGLGDWESCLNEAASAAEIFMKTSPYSLVTVGETPYLDLFNQDIFPESHQEVVLARAYSTVIKLNHNSNNYFTATTMGRPGIMKDIINQYLMTDGSRFTAKSGYAKMEFEDEVKNRDARLAQTIRTPGYYRKGDTYKTSVAPNMNACETGYQIIKFVSEIQYDDYNASESDIPLIRAAEVYLNFAEAKAELNKIEQADLDASINLLRSRAGVAPLNLTVANNTPDPYLTSSETGYANVSGNNQGVILEIRRERTVELMCEGHRYWDIMRWKEGKRFTRKFTGMYFHGVDDYDLDSDGENDFCIYDGEEPNNKIPAKASIASLNLTEGTSGNIVRHTTYKRVWQEDRDYLYPIPTDDIELTFGAIKQNPGWNDGMN